MSTPSFSDDNDDLETVVKALQAHIPAGTDDPDHKPVLLVDDHDQHHSHVQALLARLEAEGLGDCVLIVGPGSTLPTQDLGIEHVIKAIQDRDAFHLSLALPNEPAWLTEQHNRKPTPRKR